MMLQNILLVFVVAGQIALASELEPKIIKGGDNPFPYGDVVTFPWDSIKGCWKTIDGSNIFVSLTPFELGSDKLVDIKVRSEKDHFAVGLGNLRNNIVSALMSAQHMISGESEVYLANIGNYCIRNPYDPMDICVESMGISLIHDNEGEISQQDHILVRAHRDSECTVGTARNRSTFHVKSPK